MPTMEKPVKAIHPYLRANWLSKLSFWWLTKLFYRGYKNGLEPEDMYDVLPFQATGKLVHDVENVYNHTKSIGRKKNLVKSLITVMRHRMIFTGFLIIITEGIAVSQPMLVGQLVSYFEDPTSIAQNDAYLFGALLALSGMFLWVPTLHFFYMTQVIGMDMRTACSGMIYKKFFRLSQSSVNRISTGRIVNLLSTDIEKFNFGTMFFHFIWMSPLEMAVVLYLLYTEVGFSFLPGLAFFVIILPYQAGLAKVFNRFRYKIASLTDKRIHVMSEIIGAMRVIKMYCWEKPFGDLVSKLRRSEMKYVWRNANVKGLNENLSFISPKIATFFIILTFYLSGGQIRASLVIKVIGWTELMKNTILTLLSLCVQYTMELLASIDRIQTFLDTPELETIEKSMEVLPNKEKEAMNLNTISQPTPLSTAVISLDGFSASWNPTTDKTKDVYTLKNINLHVSEGELVAIIGDVGSGKSSLLMALLEELPGSRGSTRMSGKVAFVPQESWVFSGTVRDNILFGEKYKNDRYEETVKACSLKTDFRLMTNQDFTLIGEKGLSLSGGQKARINLARAAYREVDICLMDDPLSAVDTKVARHLFEQCICGQMKEKTRILVTHQVQFLRRADKIVVMQDGSIIANGSYEEVSKFIDIASVVATEKDKEKDKEKDGEGHLVRDVTRTSSQVTRRRRQSSLDSTGSDGMEVEVLDDQNEYQPVQGEDRFKGSVSSSVYSTYFRAGMGVVLFPLFALLTCAAQASINLSDWILSEWETRPDQDTTLYIYIGLFCGVVFVGAFRSIIFFAMTSLASRNLHDSMFRTVLRAPISFFDKNPVGRVLNRFSRDIGFMDDTLPQSMHQVTLYLASFTATIIFISVANYWTLLLSIPVMIVIMLLRQFSLKTMRDIKRIEAAARSPVYSHVSATLVGLPIVRAFKVQETFIQDFFRHQDNQTSPWMLYLAAQRWFGIRLDWCVAVYMVGYILAAFLIPNADGGMIGLSLSYIMALLGNLQYIVKQTAETESLMTSVERVAEYTRIEPEAELHNEDCKPPKGWPTDGNLEFKDMCLTYEKDAPPVIKNIDLSIKAGEKIGIVGRTGAGKSSLISCLLRLNEPTGNILIDDLEATKMGLADLRNSISIIPQDPVLFSGTLRYNLDPLSEYSDDQLWNALSQVQLSEKVRSMDGELYGEMSEAGGNLSVGQRQLVCLARAILRNKKILLIDEATANVDPRTDELIQQALKQNFIDCTVLCIAHRLHTIIDSDKVLVLDQGKVVEFNHAHILLQSQRGHFYQMVLQTGPQAEQRLHSLAKAAYSNKTANKGTVRQMAYQSIMQRLDSQTEAIHEENPVSFVDIHLSETKDNVVINGHLPQSQLGHINEAFVDENVKISAPDEQLHIVVRL